MSNFCQHNLKEPQFTVVHNMTFTLSTLLPLIMTIGAKIAELMGQKSKTSQTISQVLLLGQQLGAASELTQRLQMEGRDESTEEEATDLQAVLDREDIEDLRFNQNLVKAAASVKKP